MENFQQFSSQGCPVTLMWTALHSRPDPGDQSQGLQGAYYPDMYFLSFDPEDLEGMYNMLIPGYNGFGYAVLGVGVRIHSLFLSSFFLFVVSMIGFEWFC